MTLLEYLAAKNETQRAFSARTGIPYRTVHRACHEVCGPASALRISRATHESPTSDGEYVTVDELCPPEVAVA